MIFFLILTTRTHQKSKQLFTLSLHNIHKTIIRVCVYTLIDRPIYIYVFTVYFGTFTQTIWCILNGVLHIISFKLSENNACKWRILFHDVFWRRHCVSVFSILSNPYTHSNNNKKNKIDRSFNLHHIRHS